MGNLYSDYTFGRYKGLKINNLTQNQKKYECNNLSECLPSSPFRSSPFPPCTHMEIVSRQPKSELVKRLKYCLKSKALRSDLTVENSGLCETKTD